jgi:hypothetical protein
MISVDPLRLLCLAVLSGGICVSCDSGRRILEMHAKESSRLFPHLGGTMTDDDALEAGLEIEIDTKGTLYQGHGILVCNPIPPYEKVHGKNSWPRDLPLARIRSPKSWKR